jgi:hypothetical protein
MDESFGEEKINELAQKVIEVINNAKTETRKKSLIYCMTEEYDNRNLWENYACDYSGFCIEYDFSNAYKQMFDNYKNLIYLLPMHYLRRKPYFDIVPFFDGAVREFIFHDASYKNDPKLQIKLNRQLLMKNKDYESEKEWRFSIKNEGVNLQYYPFVSGIYAGQKINDLHLARLKKIAKKLHVTLCKQTINKARTDFDYIQIETD